MGNILKQSAIDIANAFTRWNLWRGGGGGSSTLADLTDVDVSTSQNGQVLTFDEELSKWVNTDPQDVDISTSYTSNEQVIGVWIDRKPLYRKVVNISSLVIYGNTWTNVPSFPDSVKQVIDFKGLETNDGNYFSMSCSKDGRVIQFRNNIVEINQYIVEYTKSTD